MKTSILLKCYLMETPDEALLGAIMEDYIIEKKVGKFSDRVLEGVEFQRELNQVFYSSSFFVESEKILDYKLRRYSKIILPLFADHFIAANWTSLSPTELDSFSNNIYDFLKQHKEVLPFKFARMSEAMIRHDWFDKFKTIQGVHLILKQRAKKQNFSNFMEEGFNGLTDKYSLCSQLFMELIPELRNFCSDLRNNTVLAHQ